MTNFEQLFVNFCNKVIVNTVLGAKLGISPRLTHDEAKNRVSTWIYSSWRHDFEEKPGWVSLVPITLVGWASCLRMSFFVAEI